LEPDIGGDAEMKLKLIALLSCVLVVGGIAFAHHGAGLSYQMDKTVTVKGTVTSFRWANPHSQLYLDAMDGGDVVHWAVEMASPGVLSRAASGGSWVRNTLKPGDVVTVTMHPSKSGEPVGDCDIIVLPDGRWATGTGCQNIGAPGAKTGKQTAE
jgi:hypothetical protein